MDLTDIVKAVASIVAGVTCAVTLIVEYTAMRKSTDKRKLIARSWTLVAEKYDQYGPLRTT